MPGCSHGVVSVKYTFQAVASDIFTASPSRPKKVWTRANFRLMREYLQHIDWVTELQGLNVQQQYKYFLNVFNALEEHYVPEVEPANKLNVPWPINPPRLLTKEKSNA